ncbi:acyl-CoA synthetase FdrA, partial [Bacillus cereus group sp. BC311]
EIGIVAASGTGLQEATCRVHQLGFGISQALGTGGHDLHQDIGGISMLTGLQALIEDEQTKVIVLISKPPAQEIADRIIKVAQS